MTRLLDTWLPGLLRRPVLLVLGTVLASSIPIVLLVYFSTTTASQALRSEILSANLATARAGAAFLGTLLEDRLGFLAGFSSRPLLRQAIARRDRDLAVKQLREFRSIHSEISRVFLALPDGRLWVNFPEVPEVWGRDMSHRPWYRGLLEKQRPYVSEVYRRTAEDPPYVVALVAPIRDPGGQLLGIVGLQIPLVELGNSVSTLAMTKGSLYVVDQRGQIVSHSRLDPAKPPEDFSTYLPAREALAGREGIVEMEEHAAFETASGSVLCAYAPIARTGWGIIVQVPIEAAFAPIRKLAVGIGSLGLVLLLLVGAGAAAATRLYAQRERLLQEVEDARTDLDRRVRERTAELQSLYVLGYKLTQPRETARALDLALEIVTGILNVEGGQIVLFDPGGTAPMLTAQIGLGQPLVQALQAVGFEQGPFGTDLLRGKTAVIQIPHDSNAPLFQLARTEGIQTIVAVPLMARERASGVLLIASRTPRPDLSGSVPFLEEMGRQIAMAVENVHLFERVARSKDEWERTFDAIRDPLFVHDRDCRLLLANRAYQETAGKTFDEILGRPYYEVYPVREEPIETCREGTELGGGREETHPATGRIYRLHTSVIQDDEGRPVGGVHLLADITEIRQAEVNLRVSEGRYRELVRTAPDAIIGADETGRVTFWNPAAERMFGYSENEIIGQSLTHVMPDRYREAHWRGLSRFLETGEGRILGKAVEVEGLRKDGSLFPLEVTLSAQAVDGGRYRFTGFLRDTAARKQAMESLRESEEKFRALVETTSDWVWEVDKDAVYTYASPKVKEFLGYDPEEIIGTTPFDLMSPDEAQRVRMEFQTIAMERKPFAGLVNINRHKDGRLVVLETSGVPVFDTQGHFLGYRGIDRDVTERKRAEERILQEMETSKALLEMASVLSRSLDRTGLLTEVPSFLERLLGAERCVCYLWEEASASFVPTEISGFPGHLTPFVHATRFHKEDLALLGVLGGKPSVVAIKDLAGALPEIRRHLDPFDLGSAYVLSLVSGNRFIGFLLVGYLQPRKLTERDLALAKGITDQLALFLVNADLYREASEKAMELAHRMETLQVMHEIDRSILSTLDRGEILETATLLLGRLIPCDRCTVVQVDYEAGGFRYVAGWGLDAVVPMGVFVPFDETNATEVVRTRRPVSRPSITPEGLLPLDRKFFEAGFRSDLRLPIIVHGEVAALLNIGSRRPGAFTPDHLATAEKVVGQIGVALENARLIEDLDGLFLGTVKTLSAAIDAKSPWTKGHSERVTEYALSIGREMGLSETDLKHLRLSGLLHDIGKIGTYEALLDKPEKLTREEYDLVKVHPAKGAEILSPIKQLKEVIPGVRSHHERWDGAGYPDGLAGENIPLCGRILAVADTYDSINADRPYRQSPGHQWALEEIQRCSGSQFDPGVVEAFLRVIAPTVSP